MESQRFNNFRVVSDFWELQDSGQTMGTPRAAGASQGVLGGAKGLLLQLRNWKPWGCIPMDTTSLTRAVNRTPPTPPGSQLCSLSL